MLVFQLIQYWNLVLKLFRILRELILFNAALRKQLWCKSSLRSENSSRLPVENLPFFWKSNCYEKLGLTQPLAFWCFRGVSKEISGMKWVKVPISRFLSRKKGKLSEITTHCHSFLLTVIRCHSLSFVVPLVVTRCITRLSFNKRSVYCTEKSI